MDRETDQSERGGARRRRADDEKRLLRAAELLAGLDYREKVPRQERPTEDDLAETVRTLQESGELRHLYGKPLDLNESTSDWLVRRILQDAGFSHPLLERAKDLDILQKAADEVVEDLRERRAWLAGPEGRCTPQRAHSFNQRRLDALEVYRERLVELDRAILGYNLSVPIHLQRRQLRVDELVSAAAEAVPPLELQVDEDDHQERSPSRWGRLRSLRRRRR